MLLRHTHNKQPNTKKNEHVGNWLLTHSKNRCHSNPYLNKQIFNHVFALVFRSFFAIDRLQFPILPTFFPYSANFLSLFVRSFYSDGGGKNALPSITWMFKAFEQFVCIKRFCPFMQRHITHFFSLFFTLRISAPLLLLALLYCAKCLCITHSGCCCAFLHVHNKCVNNEMHSRHTI